MKGENEQMAQLDTARLGDLLREATTMVNRESGVVGVNIGRNMPWALMTEEAFEARFETFMVKRNSSYDTPYEVFVVAHGVRYHCYPKFATALCDKAHQQWLTDEAARKAAETAAEPAATF